MELGPPLGWFLEWPKQTKIVISHNYFLNTFNLCWNGFTNHRFCVRVLEGKGKVKTFRHSMLTEGQVVSYKGACQYQIYVTRVHRIGPTVSSIMSWSERSDFDTPQIVTQAMNDINRLTLNDVFLMAITLYQGSWFLCWQLKCHLKLGKFQGLYLEVHDISCFNLHKNIIEHWE